MQREGIGHSACRHKGIDADLGQTRAPAVYLFGKHFCGSFACSKGMLKRQDLPCLYPPHHEPHSVNMMVFVVTISISHVAINIDIIVPAAVWTLQDNMPKPTPGRPSLYGLRVEVWDMFQEPVGSMLCHQCKSCIPVSCCPAALTLAALHS